MSEARVAVDAHPLLELGAFVMDFGEPLGDLPDAPELARLRDPAAEAPLQRAEEVRAAVRDLLRRGGYKPTGRGKPASEYLVKAAGGAGLKPINRAVDAGNLVSLHSGLPISVVDLDRLSPPLRVGLAAPEASYAFNTAGQVIKLGGLLCLHDAEGPCANAVKDAQRTKTDAASRRTLALVWGTRELPGRTDQVLTWFRELAQTLGATLEEVDVFPAA